MSRFSTIFLIFSLFILVLYIGFQYVSPAEFPLIYKIFKVSSIVFGVVSAYYAVRVFLSKNSIGDRLFYSGLLVIAIVYLIVSFQWLCGAGWIDVYERQFILLFAIATALLSLSHKLTFAMDIGIHPSILFVSSFLVLITLSSLLLMMPGATTNGISPLNAIFTATSAATVTGLAVIDTQTAFTFWGKVIILITIQLGGLGVLTFTNLFSLLFRSSTSYKNHLALGSMINEKNASQSYRTLIKIVGIVLAVEFLGAVLIYATIAKSPIEENKVFFSIFHSISAFCNAGFSTLSNGLYDTSIRENGWIQGVVMWLIITGGIGYNIMIGHFRSLNTVVARYLCILGIKKQKAKIALVKLTDINSLLVLRTSIILLIVGMVGFYFLEHDGVLKGQTGWMAFVSSAFNSVTPRTAGFNNIDMSLLSTPTLLLIIALMWIGASPGSTGGGIKTTTFAIGCLNIYNQIRGKDNTVINWRLIPRKEVNQVYAIILLSLLSINTITFLLLIFEPQLDFLDALFEVVSAFSTVGLSVGITMQLGSVAKILLVIAMFLGRVSFLAFLIGVHKQIFGEAKKENVHYPDENIFIN